MKMTMRTAWAAGFCLMAAGAARGQTLWWDGNLAASNAWHVTTSWATALDGSGTPAAEPGTGNIAVFNASPVNANNVWISLNAAKSIGGLVFDNTGTTWIGTDSVANRTLTIGASGIVINSGAGTATFGSTAASSRIPLTLGAAQTWINHSANALTLNANNSIAMGAHQLAIDGPGAISAAGIISGTGRLVKDGAGTLTLTGANTYSGGTTLNSGRLRVGYASWALGASAGRVTLNGGALSSNDTFARTLANVYTVGGNVTLGHATDRGILTLSGAGTLSGHRTLTVDSEVTLSGAIGGAFDLTKAGPAVLRLSGANAYNNTLIDAGTLAITGTGSLPGWNVSGRYTVASGATLAVGNLVTEGAISTILGTGNFAAGARIGFDTTAGHRTYDAALADTAAGPLGLVKLRDDNMLFLTGNNIHTGGTTIEGGILRLSGAGATLGAATGAITVSGGTLDLGGFSRTAGAVTIFGGTIDNGTLTGTSYAGHSGTVRAILAGAGTLTKTGAGTLILLGANTYSGGTTIEGGILRLLGANTTLGAATGAITVSGGTLDLDGFSRTAGAVTISGGTIDNGTLTGTSYAGHSGTVRAVLAGAGVALTKTDTGVLTLAGANTYSGGTTIQSGALRLSGAGSLASAAISVASGATLDVSARTGGTYTLASGQTLTANGTVSGGLILGADSVLRGEGTVGNITVESGGRLAPGNSIGTLTAPNLTLQDGALLEWHLSNVGDTSDRLTLSGQIVANGVAAFDFMGTGFYDGVSPTVYTLISFGAAPSGVDGNTFSYTNLGPGLTGAFGVSAGAVTLTVIPEPGSLGTLGILAIAAILRRRLRR